MFIKTAFSFSSVVQRWVCRFSGLRLVALRWFLVFLASSRCAASASSYCFGSAAPRLGGAVLFRGSCPSPNPIYRFWLLALTFRSSRPAFCGRLTSPVRLVNSMFPYISKSFEYPINVNAVECLKQTLGSMKWSRMRYEIHENSVVIEHILPTFFRNSWNPIFQGRIESIGNRQKLIGYFRLNWFVLVFVIIFIGFSLYKLLQTYFSPDVVPGYVPNWRSDRLAFDIQFVSMAVGINVIGWAIGIPYQRRIVTAIRESMHA